MYKNILVRADIIFLCILALFVCGNTRAVSAEAKFVKPILVAEEGTQFASVSVERMLPDAKSYSVAYETRDATASAGQDYIHTSGILTFTPNQRFKEFRVPLLHDDILDGGEIVEVLLKSADGSATIDVSLIVLREKSLVVSPGFVHPGQMLTLSGAFHLTKPLFVRFSDYAGNNIRIRANQISKSQAYVRVPCLINSRTGNLSGGKVILQTEQGKRILGPSKFITVSKPSQTGEAPGVFALEFVKITRETLALAQARWLAIESQSQSTVDASELRITLQQMDAELGALEFDLQSIIDGVTESVPLCTIGTTNYTLDSESLRTLDRMFVSAVFDGTFQPSFTQIASFRANAENITTTGAAEDDSIQYLHDEFNPALKENLTELFDLFGGWNEKANTHTGRVFDFIEQSIGVPEQTLAPLKARVSAGIFYSTVLVPSIVGLSALSFAEPFISLELGRPVKQEDYQVPLEYLQKGAMNFLDDNKDDLIGLLNQGNSSGRIITTLKVLAASSDKAQELLDLENETGVVTDAFKNANLIYMNRPRPVVSVNDSRVKEPTSGTVSALFKVRLSHLFDKPVTVYYSTTPDTANASDFSSRTGSITIPKGKLSMFIKVPILADKTKEDLETFHLTLTGINNGMPGDTQAVCTIQSLQVPPRPPTVAITSVEPIILYRDAYGTDWSVIVKGSVTGGNYATDYTVGWDWIGNIMGITGETGRVYPYETETFETGFISGTEIFLNHSYTYVVWVRVYDSDGNVIASDSETIVLSEP